MREYRPAKKRITVFDWGICTNHSWASGIKSKPTIEAYGHSSGYNLGNRKWSSPSGGRAREGFGSGAEVSPRCSCLPRLGTSRRSCGITLRFRKAAHSSVHTKRDIWKFGSAFRIFMKPWFDELVDHPGLTNGVIIQTISEFLSGFMNSKMKKRDKRKK